jgi:hypothetical protein
LRIKLYVRADGENWMVAKIRHSPMAASAKVDSIMYLNGWVPWTRLREKFNELKKRVAKGNPTKYPNWKQVEIPMRVAKLEELPPAVQPTIQLLDANGNPIVSSSNTTSDSADRAINDAKVADAARILGLPDFK